MTNTTDQGKRAGGLLRYRRTELNPAWRDRKVFAAANNLTYRVVNDLENGNRANFEPGTIAGIEVAYKLTPGSLRRMLAGGALEPAPMRVPAPRRESPGRFQLLPGGGGQFTSVSELDIRARDLVSAVTAPDAAELRAAIQAAGPGATGTDIFDDPTLAQIWDLNACSPEYRLTLMAVYLLRLRGEPGPAHRVS